MYKKYYNINWAFPFTDKEWVDKVCLKTAQIINKNSVSRYDRNFYFEKEDFYDKFWSYVDADDFDLWLKNLVLVVEVSEDPVEISKNIPEKK